MTIIPFNPDSNSDKHFIHVTELATKIRGPFLEQAIYIERLLDDIIANFFCTNEYRKRLFFSLVINGTDLTFSNKTRILQKLLELVYPELIKGHPKLFESLDKIRRFRNRLAHAMLDTLEEYLNKQLTDQIQLKYFEDGQTKEQIITTENIKQRLRECSQVVLSLIDVQSKVNSE